MLGFLNHLGASKAVHYPRWLQWIHAEGERIAGLAIAIKPWQKCNHDIWVHLNLSSVVVRFILWWIISTSAPIHGQVCNPFQTISCCTPSELLSINVIHTSAEEAYWFQCPWLGIHECKPPNQSVEQIPSNKGLVAALTCAGGGGPRATSHLSPALLATPLPKVSWVSTLEQSPRVVFFSLSATMSLESSGENDSFWFIQFSLSGVRISYCFKLNDACWMRWPNRVLSVIVFIAYCFIVSLPS